MKGNSKTLLLLLALFGGGLFALWHFVLDGGEPPEPAPVVAVEEPAAVAGESAPGLDAPTVSSGRADGSPRRTVDEPLEIVLDVVRASGHLEAEGAGALGGGARASLTGGLYKSDQSGVQGYVSFVAGANVGRVLDCDSAGRFGASDLQPGISVVETGGPGILGSRREVRLRNGKESLLNIGYGRLTTVIGDVEDRAGEPIEGATVSIDGLEATTDDRGIFELHGIASGHRSIIALASKAGYSTHRQLLAIPAGKTVPRGTYRFTLERSGSLQLHIPDRVGAAREAQVYLLPDAKSDMGADRRFPWYTYNPSTVYPGGSTVIEGLRPGSLRVLVFHAGAKALPKVATARIQAGKQSNLTVNLEPAPLLRGLVVLDGKPVAGALVRLEAPDSSRAMVDYLGETNMFLESHVLTNLPAGVQTTKSDALGEFQLSANEELCPVRYLTARSQGGKLWAGRVVNKGERKVELVLEPAREGTAVLRIATIARSRDLPVNVRVNGTPRDRHLLTPDGELEIGGLVEGDWRIGVRWSTERMFRDHPLAIEGETDFYVSLPEGAL